MGSAGGVLRIPGAGASASAEWIYSGADCTEYLILSRLCCHSHVL